MDSRHEGSSSKVAQAVPHQSSFSCSRQAKTGAGRHKSAAAPPTLAELEWADVTTSAAAEPVGCHHSSSSNRSSSEAWLALLQAAWSLLCLPVRRLAGCPLLTLSLSAMKNMLSSCVDISNACALLMASSAPLMDRHLWICSGWRSRSDRRRRPEGRWLSGQHSGFEALHAAGAGRCRRCPQSVAMWQQKAQHGGRKNLHQ